MPSKPHPIPSAIWSPLLPPFDGQKRREIGCTLDRRTAHEPCTAWRDLRTGKCRTPGCETAVQPLAGQNTPYIDWFIRPFFRRGADSMFAVPAFFTCCRQSEIRASLGGAR